MDLDAVVFGGGVAGLWLLDELTRRGCRALLLEAAELGRGQTIGTQGIIHGGLKYTLQGLLTASAANIREMPAIWRECLAGQREPDLRGTRIRSESCHLWRTDSVGSRLGMIGARVGLRVAPKPVDETNRPAVLKGCPGTVARLDEPVISSASLLSVLLARHRDRILRIDPADGCDFELDGPGRVQSLTLDDRQTGNRLTLRPRHVVFTAGEGNAELRRQVGLPVDAMQRRPLHMLLLRGDLPELNGHCVDGARTRVTVTTDVDAAGRTVWQVGGQIAEDGVRMDEPTLVARGVSELQAVIPGLELTNVDGATYRIDRAEAATTGGKRPDTAQILVDGNVVTAWPTKLVLAPQLATEIAPIVQTDETRLAGPHSIPDDWPRPKVALPPWETRETWYPVEGLPRRVGKAA